ncbi:MAG: DUF6804 family protein [Candidatus Kapaibacterium sp.]
MKESFSIAIKLVLAILFGLCLLDMPYGYYQLVRFIGMVLFGVLAYEERENKFWLIFWASSALLINPFIKVSLGRSIWNIMDVIWGIVLLISILLKRKGVY